VLNLTRGVAVVLPDIENCSCAHADVVKCVFDPAKVKPLSSDRSRLVWWGVLWGANMNMQKAVHNIV